MTLHGRMHICLRNGRVATLADVSNRLGAVSLTIEILFLTLVGGQASVPLGPR